MKHNIAFIERRALDQYDTTDRQKTGAVLMYSMCDIMAGGFSTLSSRAMDDRRVLSIFLSIEDGAMILHVDADVQ